MIPDNCECCSLEIGDGADCKRSRYDDEKQEVVPGNQCPFVMLAAKERGCERLRDAGTAFLRKYDEIDPKTIPIYLCAARHGVTYKGETYAEELKRLRAALSEGGE